MKRSLLINISIVIVLFLSNDLLAQRSQVTLVKERKNYRLEYQVLKNDTAIRNGWYKYFYKNRIIESGFYKHNRPVGLWRYYSLKGIFEYEYDYSEGRVTRLSGDRDPDYETPCLFKGSPIIPYLYIVENVNYPKEALDKNLSGKVVLGLKINKKGEVWSLYLVEKMHKSFDAEVLRVARDFPLTWQWLSATKFGEPVDGEYLITIEFELLQ
ncbi:MAG: energy transducer TonB [Marinilabiliaceae bacterium]|nr:energy transducer TonB [Marinilabiliaceae bacterium]